MKNILLLVHDDAGQESRFQAALDVTRALNGHLCCVDVVQIPALYADATSTAATTMLLEDEYQREGHNREVLEQRIAKEGVSWDWQDHTGTISEIIADQATLADLIVLNRKLDSSPFPDARGFAGDVLLRAHKPVLAVPETLTQFRVGGRALIAWDGSEAVAATMRACVPLLQLASSVRLYCVETGNTETDVSSAASYLSRHGIHAEIQRAYDGHHPVAEIILNECSQWNADWCLIGAYGHGRVREALFGGVTRQMLGQSEVPLVLGH